MQRLLNAYCFQLNIKTFGINSLKVAIMSNVKPVTTRANEVYLDNNATTRVLPQVMEVVIDTMEICYGNPSSSHITGVRAKHVLETTRGLARKVIGAGKGEIIFTSGATEGIQNAIVSALLAAKEKQLGGEDCYLLYGATEHKAVPNTLEYWNKVLSVNATLMAIPVDGKGLLDMDFIDAHVGASIMICTMAVNNETGVYQDLAALDAVIRSKNTDVSWMVDCVQTLGKSDLNISETTIDYAPFSGHKIYAPKGIGMLYVREGTPCTPFIAGGGQEGGLRSGTENIPGIAAMGRVFELLLDENDDTFKSAQQLEQYRSQIAQTLIEVFGEVAFNNDFSCSVPTTINFAVQGLSSKEVMDLCDAASIRVSSGSACSAKVTRSFVLDEMGLDAWRGESAIRMSFGPAATSDEINQACEALRKIKPALKHSCLILSDALYQHDTGLKTGFLQLIYNDCCCWLYVDAAAGQCIIIDPVPQLTERIVNWMTYQNLSVTAVVDTHTHEDHASYHSTLRNILGDFMVPSLGDIDENGWPLDAQDSIRLPGGHKLPCLRIGDMKVAVLNTPGHTNDSLSMFFVDKASNLVFALLGDLLMPGGFGRTDNKEGDCLAFYQSLNNLSGILSPTTVLGTSHDYQHKFVTTLQSECVDNELLARVVDKTISAEQFAQAKTALDEKLVSVQSEYLCGLVEVSEIDEPYSLPADDIIEFLVKHPDALVIDVRESYENEVGDIQSQLKLKEPALSVPLARLADFVVNGDSTDNKPLLMVCRTGNRSMLACKSLLRLGYSQVYNIKGGLALFSG
jgi:cysteine desulfurase